MHFQLGEFVGLEFERRFSNRRHVVFHKPVPTWLVRMFVRLGFGITILFFEYDSVRDYYFRLYRSSTDLRKCQASLDRMLGGATRAESLQIRVSRKYDLSVVSRLTGLKHLHIGSRLKNPLDLGQNMQLETLSLGPAISSQVTGLAKLENLSNVILGTASVDFLQDLPNSTRSLSMSGWIPAGLGTEYLRGLRELSLDSVPSMSFEGLAPLLEITHLTLDDVKKVENPERLKEFFPNLQVLQILSTDLRIRRSLIDNLPRGCQLIQNISAEALAKLNAM
ncbi:MAG: hypothetical protein RL510_1063 [Actinomycetota bacterium]